MTIKTLQKRGNSHALVIEKALMEQLQITPDTPLQIVVSGGALIVTPLHHGLGTERVDSIMGSLRDRYGDTLKALAAGAPGD